MKVVVTHATPGTFSSHSITIIHDATHAPLVSNGVLNGATETGRYTFAEGYWLSAIATEE